MHEFIKWLSVCAEMCAAERLNRTYSTINGQFAIITVHVRTLARAQTRRQTTKENRKKNVIKIWKLKTNLKIETLRALEQTAISILNGDVDAFVLQKNEFMLVEVTRATCTFAYVLSHSNCILIYRQVSFWLLLFRVAFFLSPVCSSHSLSLLWFYYCYNHSRDYFARIVKREVLVSLAVFFFSKITWIILNMSIHACQFMQLLSRSVEFARMPSKHLSPQPLHSNKCNWKHFHNDTNAPHLNKCVRARGRAKNLFWNNWSRKTGAAAHVFQSSRDSRQIDTRRWQQLNGKVIYSTNVE